MNHIKVEEESRIDEIMLKNIFGDVDGTNEDDKPESEDTKENILETANKMLVRDGVSDIFGNTKETRKISERPIVDLAKLEKVIKWMPKKRKHINSDTLIKEINVTNKNPETKTVNTKREHKNIQCQNNTDYELPATAPDWTNVKKNSEPTDMKGDPIYQNSITTLNKMQTKVTLAKNLEDKKPNNNKNYITLEKAFKPDQKTMCQICKKIFNQIEIEEHIKSHMKFVSSVANIKSSICSYCNLEFATESLKMHIDTVHVNATKPEEFKCKFCERKFPQTSNLNTHMKNLHLEDWAKWKVSQISTVS